jgi:hypothetical protein
VKLGVIIELPEDAREIEGALRRVENVLNAPPAPGFPARRWAGKRASEHVHIGMGHAISYLRGRRDEDHLAHAACRILMAMAITYCIAVRDAVPSGPEAET